MMRAASKPVMSVLTGVGLDWLMTVAEFRSGAGSMNPAANSPTTTVSANAPRKNPSGDLSRRANGLRRGARRRRVRPPALDAPVERPRRADADRAVAEPRRP